MAGDDLQSADFHTPKDQTTRLMGISRHGSGIQDISDKLHEATE
jgi:hypothetical protein